MRCKLHSAAKFVMPLARRMHRAGAVVLGFAYWIADTGDNLVDDNGDKIIFTQEES